MFFIKKIYLFGFFLFINFTFFSQILGGRSNGEMSPKIAQPSTLSGGTFSGDVNNMTGSYQASIPLGTVATPGGLSFGLSLEHSSSFSFSTNEPKSSGIPYGDGWSLSLPSITVETDILNAFINSCGNSALCGVGGTDNNDPAVSTPYRAWDGDLFWFSPRINIPGVGSGQAVFKYIDESNGGCAVFVLNMFETPIELRFYGTNWEARLADGTVYSFGNSIKTYRAPTNKRTFYYDCLNTSPTFNSQDPAHSALVHDPNEFNYGSSIERQIEPTQDFGTWYCDRIYNRNIPLQNIIFTYETFGEFNYFKEFLQPHYGFVHRDVFKDATYRFLPDFKGVSDILLTKIESFVADFTAVDILELDYKTLTGGSFPHGIILNPNAFDVERLDSLYSSRVIASNLNNAEFDQWNRYKHKNSDGLDPYISATNPYLSLSNSFNVEANTDDSRVRFNHSFIESPRLNINGIGAGDIFEIRTKIVGPNPESLRFGNGTIDIAVVTSSQKVTNVDPSTSFGMSSYNLSRGTEIFSTFNMGMKWTRGNLGALETSNYFVMPNLPNDFMGFNVQIGPGNSEINYAHYDPSRIKHSYTDPMHSAYYPNALTGYPQLDAPGTINSSGTISHNFGIGLPWGMMAPVFNTMALAHVNQVPNFEDLYMGIGTIPPDSEFPNGYKNPTKLNNDVYLQSFELVQYSKNAYMLQGVRQYKINGTTGEQIVEGKKLVAQKKIEYISETTNVTLKNLYYQHNDTLEVNNKGSVVLLLSKVHDVPVEGSLYAPNFNLSHPEIVLTTSIEYTNVIPALNPTNSTVYLSSKPYQGLRHYAITKFTDHLGGVTSIDYYDVSAFPTRIVSNISKNNSCPGFNYVPSYGAGSSYTMHLAVKYISKNVENYNNLTETFIQPVRKWEYIYSSQDQIYKRSSYEIPGNRFKGQFLYHYDLAFGKVTVYSPELASGERNYTIYEYHGMKMFPFQFGVFATEQEHVLYGKLKSVRVYDHTNVLHEETIYNYDYTLAAEDGFNRPNFYKKGIGYYDHLLLRDYEYEDYYKDEIYSCDNPQYPFNNSLPPTLYGFEAKKALVPPVFFYNRARFLPFHFFQELRSHFYTITNSNGESSTVNGNPDYLFNSYFVKKTSETHRIYENGLSKSSSTPIPVYPASSSVLANPFGPVIVNPVIFDHVKDPARITAIHTDFEDAIPDLIAAGLLCDSVLIHLITERSISPTSKGEVLITQQQFSSKVWKSILDNHRYFPRTFLTELIALQPYFEDELQEYIVTKSSSTTEGPGSRFPFPEDLLTQVLLKNSLLSDSVIKKMAQITTAFPGQSFATVLQAQDRQFPEELLEFVIRSPQFSSNNALRVLTNQELSDQQFVYLIDSAQIDDETFVEVFEKVNLLPSESVIEHFFDTYLPSNTLMQRVIDKVHWELDSAIKNKIKAHYISMDLPINFVLDYNPLSQFCSNLVNTSRTFIETKKEYQYYEADYRGRAIGKPFELLLGMLSSIDEPSTFPKNFQLNFGTISVNRTIPFLQLKHEPSWQLFSVTTSSPHLKEASSTEQFFYLYDLQNRYDRIWHNYDLNTSDFQIISDASYSDYLDTVGYSLNWDDGFNYSSDIPMTPVFDGMHKARDFNLKTLAFQKTTFSKNIVDLKKVRTSEYYHYDSRWKFDDLFLGSPDVIHFAGEPCPPPPVNICEDCKYYNHVFNSYDVENILTYYYDYCAWEIGHNLEGGYPYDYAFCPSNINPNSCDTTFSYLNVGCTFSVDPNTPEGASGFYVLSTALSKTVQLRSVTLQVDTIDITGLNEFDDYKMDTHNEYIAEFKFTNPFINVPNEFPGNYSMVLPFTNLCVRTIDERNRHFQPKLEHNQVGLKTKYYYSKAQKTQYINSSCASDQYQTITNTTIGLPVRITVGYERSDSLSTAYEYNNAGMVTKVTEPSGKYSEYVFDGFQRLSQTSQNGERILADYTYHYWEKNPALSFQERTQENYVYSKLYNSDQSGDLEMRRAYMDPLGRAQSVITSYQYSPSNVAHIYSGSTVYDNWDRAIRTHKNYVTYDDFGTAPAAYYPASTFNFQMPYSDAYYENTPKSRAYRVSNFGVDIASPQNHVVRTTYAIANNVYTSCELNLNASELIDLMGSGNTSSNRFYRTSVLDQDNKQSVEYVNALGQKIATLKYNDANEKIITLFVYDSYGNLAKVINPKKQVSSYLYNSLGQLVKETTVDAGERKYMYNKQGLVSVSLDQQGWQYKNTFNEKNPFYRVYSYDIYGRILSIGRSKGPTDYEGYATYGPLHYQTQQVNNTEIFDYDQNGNPVNWNYLNYSFTNSSTQDWLASYRVVKKVPNESSFDPVISTKNSFTTDFGQVILEKETTYGTNTNLLATGKIVETKSFNTIGACVQKINYHYNDYDQLVEQLIRMNPDQQYGFTESWAFTSKITYPKYNYRGALLEETVDSDNNGIVDLHYFNTYDALNRLTAIYVASAEVSSKEDATLLVSYTHDDANGLVVEKTHSVTYDTTTAPFANTFYEYDIRDRLTSMTTRNKWDLVAPPIFNYKLYYDAETPYYNFNQATALMHHHNWNGNINGSLSTYGHTYAEAIPSNMQEPLLYGYRYDKINRLLRADAMEGDVISGATGDQIYDSYTVGDENYHYDKIGNITVLNRHLISTYPDEVLEQEGFIYQYQTSTNKLQGVLGALNTNTANRAYTYDENGNLLTDSYRNIVSTEYGRAAYAYNIVQNDKEINYLYSIDDQRMFKEIVTPTETKREYYLSDAMGRVVALRTEIIPPGQSASVAWEYYAHGAEREARLVNLDNNPKFEADEVNFFVYDHLGNTRMSYTPKIELVPTIDVEVFNHNFGSSLYDWEALDGNTSVTLSSGTLLVENTTGSAVAVKPGVSFQAGHTYTLTVAATEVNVSSITVEVNNIAIGTIQNSGLADTFTFVAPSTGLFDLRLIGNGSSGTREFYVKNITLKDQTLEHVAYLYIINHAADYFPYGKILREYVGTEKERYLTTQHERDEETGLDYRSARYYDADIARFLSLDPLATEFPEWSAYNYVMGNPLSLIDPSGRSPEDPNDKNKSETETSNDPPRIKSINFGLFTMTIRKGFYGAYEGTKPNGVSFSLNYTLSRETSEKKVWKSKTFVFDNQTTAGTQASMLTIAYPTISPANNTSDNQGTNLGNFISDPRVNYETITKAKIKNHVNDNGGDSFYSFNVGGNTSLHQNGSRRTTFDPETIGFSTPVNANLYNQTPSSGDGRYDSCNGYKLTIKIEYEFTKQVNRLKLVPRAPN